MAAEWQVEMYVVPSRALAAAPQPLGRAALADTEWWKGMAVPPDYRDRLTAAGDMVAASEPGLERWGQVEGNRVDVWSRQGEVRRIAVRVDMRRLDSKFAAALLFFARSSDAVLVRGDGMVVEPTINAFASALRSSKAWRFANPVVALAELDATDPD